MPKKKLLLMYWPTMTMFVDDNWNFVSNCTLCLEEKIAFKISSVPTEALKILTQDSQKNLQLLENINANCYEQLKDPARFNHTTVLCIGQVMSGLSGEELLSKLGRGPIKRILLTGVADEKKGIDLFNKRLIDKYLKKQSMNLIELVNAYINDAQYDFFENLTNHYLLKKKNALYLSQLQSASNFYTYFHGLLEQHNVVEYYLYDEWGSYVMVSFDGDINLLLVRTKKQLAHYAKLATQANVPPEICEAIRLGGRIPFIRAESSMKEVSWCDIADNLYDAKVIKDSNTYSCAYISNIQLSNISNTVKSYKKYLEEYESNESFLTTL